MNKVRAGFFSFVELPDPGAYVAWHQTNHMPEQMRIPGLNWGQRFIATAECADVALATDQTLDARHLQYYPFDDPASALPAFVSLEGELTGQGPREQTDTRSPRSLCSSSTPTSRFGPIFLPKRSLPSEHGRVRPA